MATSNRFQGFPQGTLKFLRGVRANNTKKWFEAHRSDYDQFYVAPAKEFVTAVGQRMAKLAPDVIAEPKINGSIFRINRDVRFSKDKRPYKDHLDFAFWEGECKGSGSSFFFRVSPDGVYIGTGFHQASSSQLKAFRAAVADSATGKKLATIAAKLRKHGCELMGEHYKRVPRGFTDDGPAAEFLLHNGLYVVHEDVPLVACQSDLMTLCLRNWRAALPLHRWLIDEVMS